MLHLPLLRAGRPYTSLDTVTLPHFRTGAPVAQVSQANRGLIAKDLGAAKKNQHILQTLSSSQLLAICKKAAQLFTEAELPLGDDLQSAEDYIHHLSATTGMPEALCRKNMGKMSHVLNEMEQVLGGLTHGLDLSIFDTGWIKQNNRVLSFFCQTPALGAILPSNSPGVHSLWLPAIPLKVPLVLKPGREEPWTPFRIAQAFLAAGCPPEAFSYYPSDHAGASEILLRCNRSMFFGDQASVQAWAKDGRVQIHGPGWSKIIIGQDKIAEWEKYIELMATAVVENGGRSCLNASGVWVPAHGRDIAEALAKRLAQIEARPMNDPDAQIAAFTNKKFARRISETIDAQLKISGAEDLTEKYRGGRRLVEKDGCTFLLPTVIWCEDAEHPLANVEFLFPFVSVVQVPQREILHRLGSTLVATVITDDEIFGQEIFACSNIDRLNLGPIPTSRISWDQPHEGNLFEHMYKQRAFQITGVNP